MGVNAPITFNDWTSGEPNNCGNSEECIEIWSGHHWNDVNCMRLNYFICEELLVENEHPLPLVDGN